MNRYEKILDRLFDLLTLAIIFFAGTAAVLFLVAGVYAAFSGTSALGHVIASILCVAISLSNAYAFIKLKNYARDEPEKPI